MAQGDIPVTVIGNLTGEPELRFTPSGAAVANFTVASTPRKFDRDSSEWKDGPPVFMRCSVWRQAAENVAESFTKGDRVMVSGVLRQRSYETKEGEKRTVMECEVEEIGASVKWATVKVTRSSRGGRESYGSPVDDPWSQPASSTDDPPFAHTTGYDLAILRGDCVPC